MSVVIKSCSLADGMTSLASRILITRCLASIISQLRASIHFFLEFQRLSILEYSEENHLEKDQALRIYKMSVNKAHEDALAYSMVLFDASFGGIFEDILSITSGLRTESIGYFRDALPLDAVDKLQVLLNQSLLIGAA